MGIVEFFVDGVVHEVLEKRRPARHLVSVLAHSLLPLRLPDFTPVSLLNRFNMGVALARACERCVVYRTYMNIIVLVGQVVK